MKHQFLKKLVIGMVFFIIATLMVVSLSEATGYQKRPTSLLTPTGWSSLKFVHQFVAVNDTAYMLFTPGQRKLNGSAFNDTTAAIVQLQVRPASDTSNVGYEIWGTHDTTGFWGGKTRSIVTNGLWTKITGLGRDSVASGYTSRRLVIGSAYLGDYPYICVVAIGYSALSNGKGNEIGNIVTGYIQTR